MSEALVNDGRAQTAACGKACVEIRPLIIVIAGALSAGCAMQRGIEVEEDFVNLELVARVGVALPVAPSAGALELPPLVALDDGLSESEAVAVALWNNAQFHADLAGLGFARADLVEAGMLPNPVLSLVFPGTDAMREGTLSLPLSLLQRPSRISVADLNLERTANALTQNGLGLVRDVRIAYADLGMARERHALLAENSELLDEIADIADMQAEAGAISELEASRAEFDRLTALADLQVALREDATALNRLLALLGVAEHLDDIALQSGGEPADDLPALDGLITVALESRPDVRAAQLAVEAAGANANWQRWQVLDFVALMDLDQQAGGDLDTGPGFQLSLPLFDRNQGGRLRATAEIERAAFQYSAARQQVIAEVRESYATYAAASSAVQAWQREIIPTAQAVAEQTERAFSIGSDSELSVLLARQRLIAARLVAAQVRIESERAAARLAYSVGQKIGGI